MSRSLAALAASPLAAVVLGAASLAEPSVAQVLDTPPLEQPAEPQDGEPTGLDLDTGDPLEAAETQIGVGAVIRALDKFTGERAALEIGIDGEAQFQRMSVTVRRCLARVSARDTEATAFVQIFDQRVEPPERVFSGWMFSSSPALSALDHPRYDFWVASCKTTSSDASD